MISACRFKCKKCGCEEMFTSRDATPPYRMALAAGWRIIGRSIYMCNSCWNKERYASYDSEPCNPQISEGNKEPAGDPKRLGTTGFPEKSEELPIV